MALRNWLDSIGGKVAAAGLLLVATVAVVLAVRNAFGPPAEVTRANQRIFIDAETGKPFRHELKMGEMIPVRAPSGGQSGYPAELCFWTRDGQIKDEPTPVLINEELGKSGPTFCTDCERLVRPHNPRPSPGDKPPPSKAEYRPRAGQSQEER
jgi:hypothetical protein